MKAQPSLNDPGRILAHASLYLWKYWRQYALTAWENAESILRQAYDAVEEEDRILLWWVSRILPGHGL